MFIYVINRTITSASSKTISFGKIIYLFDRKKITYLIFDLEQIVIFLIS